MVTLDDLLNVDIFKNLPKEDLSALLPHLTEKTFPAETTIICRGDPGYSMFMLLDGTVVVNLTNDEGVEYPLATMGAGEIFGEMALLTGEPRSANVKSISSVRLLELGQEEFFKLVAIVPELMDSLLRLMIQRRAKNAVQKEDVVARGKGSIATLFAEPPPEIDHLVGRTKWSKNINETISCLADSLNNVLIHGESGTGKSLTARLIHFNGPGKGHPLYLLNCANPPPVQRESKLEKKDLLLREIAQESALFGHCPDAGSYAQGLRRGYLELSDDGAVILLNIDSLSLQGQQRLVQFLKGGTFTRIGGTEQISSKVRVIATISENPEELVRQERLNPELMDLIGREVLHLKPLRERKKDIPEIAKYFLEEYNYKFGKNISGFSKGAMNMLVDHDWPLNADGLRQMMERAVVLTTGVTIEESHIFLHIPTFSATGKFNLLKISSLRNLASHNLFPTGLRFITVPFILALIMLTLVGPEENNPANLIVWAVWWPFLVFSIIVSARAWCGYCPLPIISDGINFYRKKFLPVPSFLIKNGLWIAGIGFALILLSEHAAHMFTAAHATSLLLLTILGGTVITNFFFGKRAWCKHICPLGKLVSQLSTLSFVELGTNNTVCSSQCQSHDCVKDENCPMGIHPSAALVSKDCILCLACVKKCQHQAVHINMRSPLNEILEMRKWELSGAFFSISLAALILAIKLPEWNPLAGWLVRQFADNSLIIDVVIPVLIGLIFGTLIFAASGFFRGKSWEKNFTVTSYAYLPLVFAGFFNIYFHEFVYHGPNLIPWVLHQVSLQGIVPATWITPNLGTLKILIPLLTLIGSGCSLYVLKRLSEKHAIPLFVRRTHQGIMVVATLFYLLVL